MSSKKIFFFVRMYKMYLISVEGYVNAGVHPLRIRKTSEIWERMKNEQDGTGVKNMSDLVLKEIYRMCGKKNLQKSKLKNTK